MQKAFAIFFSLLVTFTGTCLAQQFVQEGITFKRTDCKFVMAHLQEDTISVKDPLYGEQVELHRYYESLPVSVNGKKIYTAKEVSSPAQHFEGKPSVESYLMKNLAQDLRALSPVNDTFRIHLYDVVLDEKGKVVFYKYDGLLHGSDRLPMENASEKLGKKISMLMSEAPAMQPAQLNGANVAAISCIFMLEYLIELEGREIKFIKSSFYRNKYMD